MRRITVFALLLGAMWLTVAETASAGHHRCRHRGHGCCYSSCCSTGCNTCYGSGCAGGVCTVAVSAPATIVVQLPADAILSVDGTATTSTSAVRTFVTPDLANGQTYTYSMQVRHSNGEVVTQQVNFRAGEQATVRFDAPAVAVTQR